MDGRDLLGYAVNALGGDKLSRMYEILDEMTDLGDITRRAISLINPSISMRFWRNVFYR